MDAYMLNFTYNPVLSEVATEHVTWLTTGSSKKVPAKFGDTCSVRAEGLCIGCLGQWAERGWEN